MKVFKHPSWLRLLAPLVGLLAVLWPKEKRAVALLFTANQGVDGNMAAMAHEIAAASNARVYFLDHRGKGIAEAASEYGAVYVPGGSFAELHLRLRCRRYLISHSHKPLRGVFSLIPGNAVVNVWHGIPIKGMGNLDAHFRRRKVPALFSKNKRLTAFTVSSELERSLIAGCFFIDATRIAVTGMPRLDWLLAAHDALPSVLEQESARLDSALRGRRLVLYAPTFRDYDRQAIGFDDEKFRELGHVLKKHNAVLGVRPHPRDAGLFDALIAKFSWALDLSSKTYSEPAVLMRRADVLVSDYSSIWIEYLLLERPVIAWAWDRSRYEARRGLMMNLDSVFPGPVVEDFGQLCETLADALEHPQKWVERNRQVARLFHHFSDGKNASRVWGLLEAR